MVYIVSMLCIVFVCVLLRFMFVFLQISSLCFVGDDFENQKKQQEEYNWKTKLQEMSNKKNKHESK